MIAQSVAEILSRHVKLSVEAIDRMYLNVYVPRLQTEQGVVQFFRGHRGQPLPSAALMSPMSRGFVAKLESFVARHGVPLVQLAGRIRGLLDRSRRSAAWLLTSRPNAKADGEISIRRLWPIV